MLGGGLLSSASIESGATARDSPGSIVTAAPENLSAWNTANKPGGATGPPKNIGSLEGLKRSLGNISARERLVGRLMMTPVASAPSSWVARTTASRRLGAGRRGLAVRSGVSDEPCAQ